MAIKKEKEVKEDKGEKVELDLTGCDTTLKAVIKKTSFDGKLGMGGFVKKKPLISTGSLGLDLKFGGGLARDRVIEYYGPSGSCKTSLALLAMADYAKKFGYDRTLFIADLERTITAEFVAGFGLDPDRIFVMLPKSAEDCLNMISNIMSSGSAGFGILDSIDGLESDEDRKKAYGEESMMKLPKLLSQAMRDLSKSSVDNDCGLLLINQVRTGMSSYQAVEKTSGGNAIPFYASQRLRVSKKGKSENRADALEIKATPKKNKLASLVEAESTFDFIPGKGIDVIGDFMNAAEQLGVISRAGAWYSILNDKDELISKVMGRNGFDNWIQEADGNGDTFIKLVHNKFFQLLPSLASKGSESEKEDSYE